MKIDIEKEKKKNDLLALISLLKVLQRKRINSDLLRTTKIGKTISNLATSSAQEPSAPEEEKQVK